MARQMFVNLPVADLPRSKAFFESLGFSFNPQFTNEQGACMVISDTIFAMLLSIVGAIMVFVPWFRLGSLNGMMSWHGIVDLIVWIANDRAPRGSTVTFGERDCDITVPNHWTLEEFRRRLLRLARFAGLPLRP